MIITFGNQKGGVGKSTLSTTFFLWLLRENVQNVIFIDLDVQQSSISELKQIEDYPEIEGLFHYFQIKEFKKIIEISGKENIFIVDAPGNLDDDHLIEVYKESDMIISPTYYDRKNFQSTLLFAKIMDYLGKKQNLFILPNQIEHNINHNKMEYRIYKDGNLLASGSKNEIGQIKNKLDRRGDKYTTDTVSIGNKNHLLNIFSKYGKILPEIKKSEVFRAPLTKHLKPKLLDLVEVSFHDIYKSLLIIINNN